MGDLQEYLKQLSAMPYSTLEKLVYKVGRQYAAPAVARPKGIRKGANKGCFRNAYYVAGGNNWTYVEGFAIADIGIALPIQHAWVVDGDGNVIETTWKEAGLDYCGIEFDDRMIRKVLLETETFGIMDFMSPTFRSYYKSIVGEI